MVDVDLSDTGRGEAADAGRLLKLNAYSFDCGITSVLKRAIRTLWIVLDQMNLMWIPTEKSWRLNERHYGALQGLNKAETAKRFGGRQVSVWRRSYDIRPPILGKADPLHPTHDPMYKGIAESELPSAESLKDTVERFLPYWTQTIAPSLRAGRKPLIAAHGNTLRALVKYLEGISDADISKVEIPTGMPLVYELDDKMEPLKRYYLGEASEMLKAQTALEQAIPRV